MDRLDVFHQSVPWLSRDACKVDIGKFTTMLQLYRTRRQHGGPPGVLGRDVLTVTEVIWLTLNFPASPFSTDQLFDSLRRYRSTSRIDCMPLSFRVRYWYGPKAGAC